MTTTTQQESNLRELNMSELLLAVSPAYLETWDKAIEYLTKDPHQRRVVTQLREALRDSGDFMDPILVEDGRISNGMHRVVAYHLEGYETVSVLTSEERLETGAYTELAFTLHHLDESKLVADEDWEFLDAYTRSFPFIEGVLTPKQAEKANSALPVWVEMSGLGSCNKVFEAAFCVSDELAEPLMERLQLIAHEQGYRFDFISHQPWPPAWDEEELAEFPLHKSPPAATGETTGIVNP